LGKAIEYDLNSSQQTCSNTYSASAVKLDSVITEQSENIDYDLLVYYFDHNDGLTYLVGGSVNDGNSLEYFSYVMPAGNYILIASPQAAPEDEEDPIVFNVGALGWSNYDSYESNENISQAKRADGSLGNYIVTGNTDNSNDRDVFLYVAGSTQSAVAVRLTSSIHTLEVGSGDFWVEIPDASEFSILNLGASGSSLYIRVRPAVGTTVDPLINYELVMTNMPENIESYRIDGDVNKGWFPGTEVDTSLTFSGKVTDQFGHAVPFIDNVLTVLVTSEEGVAEERIPLDRSGNYNHTLTIDSCSGDEETMRRWDYEYEVCWQVDYHHDDNHIWSFGLYSVSEALVDYYHVCSAKILPNVDRLVCN